MKYGTRLTARSPASAATGARARTRAYVQRARAERTGQTRGKILAATRDLLFESSYHEVTVQAVADRAGVSLNTVLRHFGSKEGLLRQGMERWSDEESRLRAVAPGDVAAIARVLADRYEQTGDVVARYAALAEEVPVLREVFHRVRIGHHAWLGEVFAPHLPHREGPARARRLAALFAATEIVAWRAWRIDLGLSEGEAQRALRESLQALVAAWRRPTTGASK